MTTATSPVAVGVNVAVTERAANKVEPVPVTVTTVSVAGSTVAPVSTSSALGRNVAKAAAIDSDPRALPGRINSPDALMQAWISLAISVVLDMGSGVRLGGLIGVT